MYGIELYYSKFMNQIVNKTPKYLKDRLCCFRCLKKEFEKYEKKIDIEIDAESLIPLNTVEYQTINNVERNYVIIDK